MTIIDYIKAADKILIVGHVKPDGDCLGSGLALYNVCEKYSKSIDILFDSPFPPHYNFLPKAEVVNVQKYKDYDLLITVDCADETRLGKYVGYLKLPKSINIDHHMTNNNFAKVNFVERKACSTCEIVYDLLRPLNEITDAIANLLFIGISTDTGHFMHSNTSSKVMRVAAELLEYKVDGNKLANNIYKNNTINKTKLIARAIDSMRMFHDNEVCIIVVTLDMLKQCGCDFSDTEGLIDYAMSIDTVKVASCIAEQNRPIFKVSFRSKGQDVAASAGIFGGGGHKLAAGCVVSGFLEDVVSKVLKSITDGME